MDSLGFGPFISWLRRIFIDLLGVGLADLALPLTYAVYCVVAVAVLIPTRRWWRRVKDRWMLMRRPLSRIWRHFGAKKPLHALHLSTRLLREARVSYLSALVGVVMSAVWFVAVRNALVPWQDVTFRQEIGQVPPHFAGLAVGSETWYSSLSDWVIILVAGLLVWFTGWSTFTQVRARLKRRAWLFQRFPARGLTWIPLIFVAAYLQFLYMMSVWVPGLPTVWAVAILAGLLLPVQASARRQDRARRGLDLPLPQWVTEPTLPPPPAAMQPAALGAGSGPSPDEPSPHAQTEVLPEPSTNSTPPAWAARTAPLPGHNGDGTRVMPTAWSGLAPTPTALRPGEPRKLGAYTISGRIGSGGMAIVYLASSQRLPQIALKVANPLTRVHDVGQRLMSEINTLSRVSDPTVVKIHDAGIIDEHPFLAMTYLKGPALNQAIAALGPLRDQEALRSLGVAIARGLAAIHAIGVHRDLKPANIILTDEGPVIVDLGIAKLRGMTTQLTQEGTALGTIGYTAPEVLTGQSATPAADVFAWGACMAYAATGSELFGGESLATQLDATRNGRRDPGVVTALEAVDPLIADVVARCTDPDPRRRPADGGALLRKLPRSTRWPEPADALA